MRNLTPTEYDDYVRVHGVRVALAHYPYTLTYQYSRSEHSWTLFYSTQVARASHAATLQSLGGRIVGASGGDVSGLASWIKRYKG